MPWDFKGELNDVQVFLDFYKIKKKIFLKPQETSELQNCEYSAFLNLLN